MNDSGPRVCVIMAAYKAAHVLPAAARSVLDQDYPNLILAIAIPQHDTETLAVARALGDARVAILEQTGKGISDARNLIMREVLADLYMFLDGDDFMKPGMVSYYVADRIASGVVGLRFGHFDIKVPDAPRQERIVRCPFLGTVANATFRLTLMNFIGTGSVMIDRAVLDSVGNMDGNFSHAEDWQYWLRISEKFPVIGLDTVAYTYTYGKLTLEKPRPRAFFDEEVRVARSLGRYPVAVFLSHLITKGRYLMYYFRTFRARGPRDFFDIRFTDFLCAPIAFIFQIVRRCGLT